MTPARIAIVDDDPAFSSYLSTLLGSRGYEVLTYPNGAELLRALGRVAAPDVVLLDVLMPGMDGLETLRAVHVAHPTVQVIMLSGTQVPATIVDAVRLGAVDYVVKPDDPEGLGEAALEAAIRSAIEKVSLTSEVARLRAQVADEPDGSQPCWGSGAAMRQVVTMIDRVADSDVSVLLTGESGVGKEVIARELHRRSGRRTRNFVKVNCAALPARAARERALRPRTRRVHGRAGVARGQVRVRPRRHDHARRDRRDAAGAPGEAAARHRGSRHSRGSAATGR